MLGSTKRHSKGRDLRETIMNDAEMVADDEWSKR